MVDGVFMMQLLVETAAAGAPRRQAFLQAKAVCLPSLLPVVSHSCGNCVKEELRTEGENILLVALFQQKMANENSWDHFVVEYWGNKLGDGLEYIRRNSITGQVAPHSVDTA
eukprot:TRINITY_DN68062_c5_g11_i1.p2 TRINITY_DN68062_c5_g11~~TRINITY_DN68062_c5_g11_i1.p2  ORF type:complete len:112 (+),score=9.59 TRINITY_DN68062_c5_g11_i1:215-550(+)